LASIQYGIEGEYIRVKYLDKEDIESLGFEQSKEEASLFNKGDYWICFTEGVHHLEITLQVDNINDTVFSGIVKNKSELKRVLKQIGI